MLARTYKNITYCTCGKALQALSACVMLMCASCASDTIVKEIEETDPNGTDPLKFTCQIQDDVPTTATRATALSTGFIVSTYKSYAVSDKQQTVMDRYTVEYKTSGTAWDGNVRPYWDYTQVSGQIQRYWDFSNFPYRFHAVAPCPDNKSAVTLTDTEVKLDKGYSCQTVTDGVVSPSNAVAEPYMLAQVHRAADGADTDILAQDDEHRNINTSSTSLNREVKMPFHHLNSKVRFAVYCLSPWVTANYLYVKDLTVKVSSSDFITSASGFNSTCTESSSWRPDVSPFGFTGLTKAASSPTLLRYSGMSNGTPLQDNDLRENQTQKTANFLQCKDGIMQIPQDGVKMTVSLKLLKADQTDYKTLADIPIKLDDNTDVFNWKPGYIYTYYLVIGGIPDKLEIEFTCTLTPWEDITGSLSTDLEQ